MHTRNTRPVSEPAGPRQGARWRFRRGRIRTSPHHLGPLVACVCLVWLQVAATGAAADRGFPLRSELVVERGGRGPVVEPPAAGDTVQGLAMGVAAGAASAAYNDALNGRTNASPLVVGVLKERVERQLALGYQIALERVREVEACQDLFAALGADGVATLSATIYLPPTHDFEVRACDAGAVAFTFVGAPQTRLCDRFGGLARQRAAILLIHEALHQAGLNERPHDPDGLTPHQIDRMVGKACGL